MNLTQISADPCRHVARLPDLDVVVRRIFPLARFLDVLRSKEMGLVAPHAWEDPREDPTALCVLEGSNLSPPKGQQPLSAYLAPVWAQCWSLNPGSDTLLRAYSRVRIDPDNQRNSDRDAEGIIVTTTVRHLLSAMEGWHSDGADSHFVIGRVDYIEDVEIGQRIVNACNAEGYGPVFFRTVQGRAETLLWKRTYFEHEQEVRLMLIARDWPRDQPTPQVRNVQIEPSTLFRSVSLDPRLIAFEKKEREAEIRDAGYTGEIIPDHSYQKIFNLLQMQRVWPDP
ncbi:hypothetical protein SAMN05518668_1351 [Sphingobium sp. YR657]|uniref:hypothetical protein n=1 Tax=Sphingobium TaxID=165695 RepID=UPI000916997A|nr:MULTISPECIES: hypothetical protein [Sphingobium]SHM74170.1 hypothetical protein SAMN05518668_1351 [Sphingobium sp. YR657]